MPRRAVPTPAPVTLCAWLLACVVRVAHAQELPEERIRAEDPRQRVRACRELARKGGPGAEKALEGALTDDVEVVRQAAAVALLKLAPHHRAAFRVLLDGLNSGDWYVRWQACLAARALGPRAADAVPVLLNLAADKEKDVVQEAALALDAVAPESDDVLDAFERLLRSDLKVDRATLLARLRDAGRTENVKAWLAKESLSNAHRLRDASFAALLPLGAAATETLAEGIEAADPAVRALAADGIGELRWAAGIPKLEAAAADPVPRVQESALRALQRFGPDAAPALPSMLAALDSGEEEVRQAALEAVGAVGRSARDDATPRLILALKGATNEKEMLPVRRALDRVGSGRLAAVLAARTIEEKEQDGTTVRRHAVVLDLSAARQGAGELLGAILMELKQNGYGPPALAALREVLDRTSDDSLRASLDAHLAWERQLAAFLLGRVAHDEAAARKALEAAQWDPDGDVRIEAKEALEAAR